MEGMDFEELRTAQWNYAAKGGAKRSPAAAHFLTCVTPGIPVPDKWNPLPRKKKTAVKAQPKPQPKPRVTAQPVTINRPGLRITIAA